MMTTKGLVRNLALCVVAGIIAASFFSFDYYLYWLVGSAMICVFFVNWRLVLLFTLIALLAYQYLHYREQRRLIVPASSVQISGIVEYRYVDSRQQYVHLRSDVGKQLILISLPRYPEIYVGEQIIAQCSYRQLSREQWRRLWSRGLDARCHSREAQVTASKRDWRYYLFLWREWHLIRLRQLLPEPESALIRATVLADEEEIPEHIARHFSRSGLSHIMAISGMNMTLFIGCIIFLLRWRGMSYSFITGCAAALLTLYIIVIGQPASAVRAALMSLLALVGLSLQRTVDIKHLFYLAVILLAVYNPWSVVYDLGWQLSFLALLGLLYWAESWQAWLRWLPDWAGIRVAVSATLAAQMFIWPLFLWHFQNLSLVAPIANIFALPAGMLLMIQGLILPLVSYIPYLGAGFVYISFLSAHWLRLVAEWFAISPLAVVSFQLTQNSFIVLMLVMVGLTCYKHRYVKAKNI